MKTTSTCRICGERIENITTCTDPMNRTWLHCGWQHEYDHLPLPHGNECAADITTAGMCQCTGEASA